MNSSETSSKLSDMNSSETSSKTHSTSYLQTCEGTCVISVTLCIFTLRSLGRHIDGTPDIDSLICPAIARWQLNPAHNLSGSAVMLDCRTMPRTRSRWRIFSLLEMGRPSRHCQRVCMYQLQDSARCVWTYARCVELKIAQIAQNVRVCTLCVSPLN